MKKRFFLVALLLVLTFLACCSVALADDGIEVPPTELISENVTFSLVDWHMSVMPMADELKITRMTAGISRSDSTHIYVRGVTEANMTCDKLGGIITIQQWKNNAWNNYTSTAYFDYFSDYADGAGTVAVETGYYYRLRIGHYASGELGLASGTTTTKSVLVN